MINALSRAAATALLICACMGKVVPCRAGPPAEPPPGEAAYGKALGLIKQGNTALALPMLWKAASSYHQAALWITMGYLYFLLEDMERSFAAYGMALNYDPGNEEVLRWFADNGREVYSGVIAVNWKPSKGKVRGYNVYLQLFKNGPFFRVNDEPVKKGPCVISGLEPEREYPVRLSALSDEAVPIEGEISAPQTVFSFHGKLRERHKTKYKVLKGGKVALEWPKCQDPWLMGYNIYIQLPGGKRFERVNHSGLIKSNKYLVKGLAFGVTYIMRIVSVIEASPPRQKTIEELAVDIPLP